MGRMIEKTATDRGHEITARHRPVRRRPFARPADVAIDFSVPSAAADNIRYCVDAGIPVVCGTTGWADQYPAIKNTWRKKTGHWSIRRTFPSGQPVFLPEPLSGPPHRRLSPIPGIYLRNAPHPQTRRPFGNRHHLGRRHRRTKSPLHRLVVGRGGTNAPGRHDRHPGRPPRGNPRYPCRDLYRLGRLHPDTPRSPHAGRFCPRGRPGRRMGVGQTRRVHHAGRAEHPGFLTI